MRRSSFRALTLLFLLAAPLRAAQLELGGEAVVAVAPPLTASAVSPLVGISAVELSRTLGPAAADQAIRAGLTEAVVAQAAKLTTLTEHMSYASASGARVVLVPFDGVRFPHLVGDSLAQAETEDRLVVLNWSLAGHDRYALERAGLPPREAERLTAASLAPVLGHEVRHLQFRSELGRDFPGLREEEILTHLDQAEAFDEVMRRERGLDSLLAQQFVFIHNQKLRERWLAGFGAVADYVLRKYDHAPSLGEAEKNLADAKAWKERWERGEAQDIPRIWRERIARAVEFWADPAEVKRVTEYFQAKINDAYARYRRGLH